MSRVICNRSGWHPDYDKFSIKVWQVRIGLISPEHKNWVSLCSWWHNLTGHKAVGPHGPILYCINSILICFWFLCIFGPSEQSIWILNVLASNNQSKVSYKCCSLSSMINAVLTSAPAWLTKVCKFLGLKSHLNKFSWGLWYLPYLDRPQICQDLDLIHAKTFTLWQLLVIFITGKS